MNLGKLTKTNHITDVNHGGIETQVWVRNVPTPTAWQMQAQKCRVIQVEITIRKEMSKLAMLHAIGEIAPQLMITKLPRKAPPTIIQVEARGPNTDLAKNALVDELTNMQLIVPTDVPGLFEIAHLLKRDEVASMESIASHCDWSMLQLQEVGPGNEDEF